MTLHTPGGSIRTPPAAPPLVVLVVMLTSDPEVMGSHASPPLLRWPGWATAALMAAAGAAMFIT